MERSTPPEPVRKAPPWGVWAALVLMAVVPGVLLTAITLEREAQRPAARRSAERQAAAIEHETARDDSQTITWESMGLVPQPALDDAGPRAAPVHPGSFGAAPDTTSVQNDRIPTAQFAAKPARKVVSMDATVAPAPPADAGAGVARLETDQVDGFETMQAASTAEERADPDAGFVEVQAAPGVICGQATCAPGKVCCNASCSICANPGETCFQRTCGMPYAPVSIGCGPNTCSVGELCCNPTCGICVSPGETCDQTPCDNPIVIPFSESCGMQTCNVGQVCCNPSCGICTAPGEPCSREVCD